MPFRTTISKTERGADRESDSLALKQRDREAKGVTSYE